MVEPGERSLREMLQDALRDPTPPSASEPVSNPVARFKDLPDPVREFLETLRADDIEDLKKILLGFRKTSTVVWFFKWLAITIVTAAVGTITFGEKIAAAIKWWRT